jgi:hypothetical protein
MKIFLHFLKSNIKYNKLELAISYFLTFGIIIVFNYFKNPQNHDGELLFSVAFYAILYAFYSNKQKFSLKYLLSLPLSKTELLLMKVASDLLYFLPAIILAFWGVLHSDLPEFDMIPLLILMIEVLLFVSFIMFDGDIEQPRLDNARSSFLNRLIYVRKMIDFFFMSVFVIFVAYILNSLPMSMLLKEYFLIILLAIVLFRKFQNSLKLMRDETLSYFVARRDLMRIGSKLGVFIVLGVTSMLLGIKSPSKYGHEEIFSELGKENKEKFIQLLKETPKELVGKKGYNLANAAIDAGDLDALKLILAAGHQIDWSARHDGEKFKGNTPAELAIQSANVELLKYLIEIKPEHVELFEGDVNPLMAAAHFCHSEMIEFLLQSNYSPNTQDKEGNTAMHWAMKDRCLTGIAIMLEYGGDPTIENKRKQSVIGQVKGPQKYFYARKLTEEKKRELASVKDEQHSLKPLAPKLPLPRK